MSRNNFYQPAEIAGDMAEIAATYQAAFAGEPWNEVSKCPDPLSQCEGGLSPVAVGDSCETCGLCPSLPAYEVGELTEQFSQIAAQRPTWWYTERGENNGLLLAATAWRTEATTVAEEKYPNLSIMRRWLREKFGTAEIVWLDEVFADRNRRSSGNLRNFGEMCDGFMERLDGQPLAFRTINPRMVAAALRDFPDRSQVYRSFEGVPDRRDVVVLKRTGGNV